MRLARTERRDGGHHCGAQGMGQHLMGSASGSCLSTQCCQMPSPATPKTRKVQAAEACGRSGLCSEPLKGCNSLQKRRARASALSGFLDDE